MFASRVARLRHMAGQRRARNITQYKLFDGWKFDGTDPPLHRDIPKLRSSDESAQLIGIGACAAYALVVSLILLMLISVTIGLRVSEEAEAAGLDVSTHGESVE